jgi:hypothetical protein
MAHPGSPAFEFEASFSLDQLQAASVNCRIAIGPHAGRKALTLYGVPPIAIRRYPRGAGAAGLYVQDVRYAAGTGMRRSGHGQTLLARP